MNRLHATKDFWLAALRADGPALLDAVTEAGPDAVVPSCPGWSTAELVEHLTAVLRRVRESAPRGVTTAPERPPLPPRPPWDEALEILRRELVGTIETLDALDPEFPAWTWPAQAKKAGFWPRRVAHEVSVHRWDAEAAAGRPQPIETKLAADGVMEILDTWLPAGRRFESTELQGVVHLTATDAAYEWFVRLRGTGVALLDTGTILDTDDHHPRAEATGTASDLQLALMGRRPIEALTVTGDPRLVQALHAA
ncbi:maleylpyruvate isomerase family mycothiol-dependent enzyme [Actinoplanes sp. NPDC051470]|uniref:maleylpyruvate isomerase family mycothiol-dependent enzyme n=1 Tax=unclassified Actinoplanes TaxID=2626549 RepID=UPI0034269A48